MEIIRFLLIAVSIFATEAFATGSVSSGGGRFIGTEANPWFLENVRTVIYCVDTDPSGFRPSKNQAQEAVRFAINKWEQTFSQRMLTDPYYQPGKLEPYSDVRLATQNFVEVDCDDPRDKDLRFQFGHLTSEQQQHLPDFKDYIGVAVRTDYDLKTLRGKGFIYIAADSGPNRPSDPDFAEDPWTVEQNVVLKAVLLHELGHLFGLRHESGRNHIMSDGLVDMIVSREYVETIRDYPGVFAKFFLNHLNVLNYDPDMEITECSPYSVAALKGLFLLDHDTRCVKLRFSHNDGGPYKLRIRVYSAREEQGPYHQEGIFTSTHGFSGQAQPIIEVKLSDEQQVFTKLPDNLWGKRLIAGYEKVTFREFDGTFVHETGKEVENIFGHIQSDGSFVIGVVRNGKLIRKVYSY